MSIGDGLSLGLNPNGIKSYNYNDYVKEYLENNQKHINYFNYSEKNISIAELTNEIIYLNNKTLKEYLQKSNLIIISIGEKELNNNDSITSIEKDFSNLINEMKKYNNNLCILSKYYINEETSTKVNEINALYKKIAKDNNIAYIDIENTSFYLTNNTNLYPTSRGYEEISKSIIKIINIKDK